MSDPDRTITLSLDDAAVALRTLPYGGIDDSTRSLRFPPPVQATVSPVIVAIRWGAVMYGMVYAAYQVSQPNPASGGRKLDIVYALVVVLFLTSWRTVRPIRLNGEKRLDVVMGFTDALLVGGAVGLSRGFDSPFIFSVVACAAVVAFGWGIRAGCLNLAVGLAAMLVMELLTGRRPSGAQNQDIAMGLLLLLAVVLAGLLRNRLLDAEGRRASLSGRLDLLSETNDLLHILNQVARTLPMSLDMREAMNNARQQIQRAFDADAIALVVLDDLSDEWTPQITEGCALRPSSTKEELPAGLRWAIDAARPILVADLETEDAGRPAVSAGAGLARAGEVGLADPQPSVDSDGHHEAEAEAQVEIEADADDSVEAVGGGGSDETGESDDTGGAASARGPVDPARPLHHVGVGTRTRCGLYTAVRARGRIVGALAVEHRTVRHYTDRDRRIIDGLGDVLALTVDNARSFRRLRTLGAEEERSRIARDLHDRLGQWLSYISFELERIITTSEESTDELDRLYSDVQTAIDELRETLRQLRSGVTDERSLAMVAGELVERFNRRGETRATLTVAARDQRLPVRVENELLRVLQESLSNVAKHSSADNVDVTWAIDDGVGTLTICDDGRGFDPGRGVRESAYGLVGMRERADVVGARISIESTPGVGTTVTVVAGRSGEWRVEDWRLEGTAAAEDGPADDPDAVDEEVTGDVAPDLVSPFGSASGAASAAAPGMRTEKADGVRTG